MSLVLTIFPDGNSETSRRDAVLSAFDLVDDGARTFEVGRADTGATCAIVSPDDVLDAWRLVIPLIRSPTSARDLIPAARAAIPIGLAAPLDADALLALWDDAHRAACRDLVAMCEAQGAPPPPHLPRAQLEHLHGWLVARRGRPIFGVDFQEGGPVVLAVPVDDDAPMPGVLMDVDGETRLFIVAPHERPAPHDPGALRALLATRDGLPLARARLVTPVEIVDTESLGPDPGDVP